MPWHLPRLLLCCSLVLEVIGAVDQRCDDVVSTVPLSTALVQVKAQTLAVKGPLAEEPPLVTNPQVQNLASVDGGGGRLDDGLVQIRIPKTGSTTLRQVFRALQMANGMYPLDEADVSLSLNGTAYVYTEHRRLKDVQNALSQLLPKAFKISMVRDPVERCMSSFYHLLDEKHSYLGSSDAEKIALLTGNCSAVVAQGEAWYTSLAQDLCRGLACPGYQTEYLVPHAGSNLDEIFESFDFIAVTERYDESMLLLSKQLELPLSDLLYVQTKVSGASSYCQGNTASSIQKVPMEEESAGVRAAAQKLALDRDALLVERANAELDRRIAAYGPSYQSDLASFREWLAVADEECKCLGQSPPAKSFVCLKDLVQERNW
mmetsp:Transcript_21335/g.39027  ORF Transcript_21335/g.39027 Transcript_21335/m.39027 type:complete len:375 (+) Transcript_21335:66-1190(+)